MARSIRTIVLVASLAAGLAACGDGGSNTSPPPVVVPPAPKLEDGFGANFGLAYRADPNSEAKDPTGGDIVPLSLTTEPTTI